MGNALISVRAMPNFTTAGQYAEDKMPLKLSHTDDVQPRCACGIAADAAYRLGT